MDLSRAFRRRAYDYYRMNGAAFASEKGSHALAVPVPIGLLLIPGFLLDFVGRFVRGTLHFLRSLLGRLGGSFPGVLGGVSDTFAGVLDVAPSLLDILSRGLPKHSRSGT